MYVDTSSLMDENTRFNPYRALPPWFPTTLTLVCGLKVVAKNAASNEQYQLAIEGLALSNGFDYRNIPAAGSTTNLNGSDPIQFATFYNYYVRGSPDIVFRKKNTITTEPPSFNSIQLGVSLTNFTSHFAGLMTLGLFSVGTQVLSQVFTTSLSNWGTAGEYVNLQFSATFTGSVPTFNVQLSFDVVQFTNTSNMQHRLKISDAEDVFIAGETISPLQTIPFSNGATIASSLINRTSFKIEFFSYIGETLQANVLTTTLSLQAIADALFFALISDPINISTPQIQATSTSLQVALVFSLKCKCIVSRNLTFTQAPSPYNEYLLYQLVVDNLVEGNNLPVTISAKAFSSSSPTDLTQTFVLLQPQIAVVGSSYSLQFTSNASNQEKANISNMFLLTGLTLSFACNLNGRSMPNFEYDHIGTTALQSLRTLAMAEQNVYKYAQLNIPLTYGFPTSIVSIRLAAIYVKSDLPPIPPQPILTDSADFIVNQEKAVENGRDLTRELMNRKSAFKDHDSAMDAAVRLTHGLANGDIPSQATKVQMQKYLSEYHEIDVPLHGITEIKSLIHDIQTNMDKSASEFNQSMSHFFQVAWEQTEGKPKPKTFQAIHEMIQAMDPKTKAAYGKSVTQVYKTFGIYSPVDVGFTNEDVAEGIVSFGSEFYKTGKASLQNPYLLLGAVLKPSGAVDLKGSIQQTALNVGQMVAVAAGDHLSKELTGFELGTAMILGTKNLLLYGVDQTYKLGAGISEYWHYLVGTEASEKLARQFERMYEETQRYAGPKYLPESSYTFGNQFDKQRTNLPNAESIALPFTNVTVSEISDVTGVSAKDAKSLIDLTKAIHKTEADYENKYLWGIGWSPAMERTISRYQEEVELIREKAEKNGFRGNFYAMLWAYGLDPRFYTRAAGNSALKFNHDRGPYLAANKTVFNHFPKWQENLVDGMRFPPGQSHISQGRVKEIPTVWDYSPPYEEVDEGRSDAYWFAPQKTFKTKPAVPPAAAPVPEPAVPPAAAPVPAPKSAPAPVPAPKSAPAPVPAPAPQTRTVVGQQPVAARVYQVGNNFQVLAPSNADPEDLMSLQKTVPDLDQQEFLDPNLIYPVFQQTDSITTQSPVIDDVQNTTGDTSITIQSGGPRWRKDLLTLPLESFLPGYLNMVTVNAQHLKGHTKSLIFPEYASTVDGRIDLIHAIKALINVGISQINYHDPLQTQILLNGIASYCLFGVKNRTIANDKHGAAAFYVLKSILKPTNHHEREMQTFVLQYIRPAGITTAYEALAPNSSKRLKVFDPILDAPEMIMDFTNRISHESSGSFKSSKFGGFYIDVRGPSPHISLPPTNQTP